MIKSNKIWTEKYRPKSLDNFVGNESIKTKISTMISNSDISHLLFYGPAGTGKTTLSKILVNNIECDYLYINASDETSVDVARNKIKPFAATMGFKPLKIVILDESDFLSANAQAALRNIIETYSKSTRFIFTANYCERIIEPILSRVQQFKLEPPSKPDVAKHIVKILQKESIEYQLPDIKLLVDAHFPDIRKIINECSSNSLSGKLILDHSEIIGNDTKLKIIEILSSTSKTKLKEIRQLVADAEVKDFSSYYDLLYQKIEQYAGNNISQVILHIGEAVRWDGQVVNKQINFITAISSITQII